MDFFDREIDGGFDEMFDMDRDGVLDTIEEGIETEYEPSGKFEWEDDDDEEEMDEIDEALDSIGYTREDLEFMDEDERAEILEDAGLDPDDWE